MPKNSADTQKPQDSSKPITPQRESPADRRGAKVIPFPKKREVNPPPERGKQ